MHDRLMKFIEAKGLTTNKFEIACGISRGTIGKLNNGIRSDKLADIALTYPDLDIRWLLTGEGEMFRPQEGQKEPISEPSSKKTETYMEHAHTREETAEMFLREVIRNQQHIIDSLIAGKRDKVDITK